MSRGRLVALAWKSAYLLFGLQILAFGIAFSIKANLGTSSISSLPYAGSCVFPSLSVGVAGILMHACFIAIQMALLRRRYQPVQLLQLPVALLFGAQVDFAVWALAWVQPASYAAQWLWCAVGVVGVAVGVAFEVTARAVPLAGEGLVLAFCEVTQVKFGTMKVVVDLLLVASAVLLSWCALHRVVGVREGTLAAALLVGMISRQFIPLLQRLPLCPR